MIGGLFLSWTRPSQEQQRSCIAKSGTFNIDPKFHGATSEPHQETLQTLSHHGFFINRARVLLGSGATTFRLAKSALLSWRHFGLDWAFVDPKTPVKSGAKFCVCAKELVPWLMMPLQIAYVDDDASKRRGVAVKASFGFGSGTLHGHLLAGEERFSVEMDENDDVWYEIFSFSKPAHLLSVIGYPYVQLRQKYFAQQSTDALLKHVTAQQSRT